MKLLTVKKHKNFGSKTKYIVYKDNSTEVTDMDSKQIQLTNLELALEDLDKIIDNMKKNNYSKEELNEYVKKRWNVWNEMHQVKKQ